MARNEKSDYKIVDSFPLVINKFGRALFGKQLTEYSSYRYCAGKKETYYGMKGHVITDLYDGEILDEEDLKFIENNKNNDINDDFE